MRLTCPNCGAQYEVPDEVMPASGRDVQCSNCGDTWFQYHPDHMPEEAQEDLPTPQTPTVDEDDDADFDDGWSDEDEGTDGDAGEDDLGDASDWEEPEAPLPEDKQPLRRRPLSPEVKTILQEEATFETRARQGDPLESQPELGLGAPDPATAKRESLAENRLARARASETVKEPPRPKAPEENASRRELLPDIEEINSTLRRKGETMRRPERTSARAAARQQRSGFRRGFMSILILAVVAAVIYLQAPKIGTAIPQLAQPMEQYVAAVDRGRVWLDAKAAELAQKLDEMSEEVSPEATPEPAPATPDSN